MSGRPRGRNEPAAKTTAHIVSPTQAYDTALDRLVARAARELLPSALTEAGWLRRRHADIPHRANWQLRHELRIITSYLDSPAGQADFYREWFEERVERLRAELARRREGGAR